MISVRLAPLGRPISARILAPLLSARDVLPSLLGAGLVAFLPAFFALAPLAAFWPLGAPFFGLVPLFEEGLLLRNVRALFRNSGGVFGGGSFCVRHGNESFLRLLAHDDSSLWSQGNARQKWPARR